MAGRDNLIPFDSNQSREKAKENGRKGGIASGIAKREKRTMRELLEMVLAQPVTNAKGETATMKEVIAVKLATKAGQGDLKAMDLLTKLTGDQMSKMEVTANVTNAKIDVTKLTDEQLKALSEIETNED